MDRRTRLSWVWLLPRVIQFTPRSLRSGLRLIFHMPVQFLHFFKPAIKIYIKIYNSIFKQLRDVIKMGLCACAFCLHGNCNSVCQCILLKVFNLSFLPLITFYQLIVVCKERSGFNSRQNYENASITDGSVWNIELLVEP